MVKGRFLLPSTISVVLTCLFLIFSIDSFAYKVYAFRMHSLGISSSGFRGAIDSKISPANSVASWSPPTKQYLFSSFGDDFPKRYTSCPGLNRHFLRHRGNRVIRAGRSVYINDHTRGVLRARGPDGKWLVEVFQKHPFTGEVYSSGFLVKDENKIVPRTMSHKSSYRYLELGRPAEYKEKYERLKGKLGQIKLLVSSIEEEIESHSKEVSSSERDEPWRVGEASISSLSAMTKTNCMNSVTRKHCSNSSYNVPNSTQNDNSMYGLTAGLLDLFNLIKAAQKSAKEPVATLSMANDTTFHDTNLPKEEEQVLEVAPSAITWEQLMERLSNEEYEKAMRHFDNGDYPAAHDALMLSLGLVDRNPNRKQLLAQILEKRGRVDTVHRLHHLVPSSSIDQSSEEKSCATTSSDKDKSKDIDLLLKRVSNEMYEKAKLHFERGDYSLAQKYLMVSLGFDDRDPIKKQMLAQIVAKRDAFPTPDVSQSNKDQSSASKNQDNGQNSLSNDCCESTGNSNLAGASSSPSDVDELVKQSLKTALGPEGYELVDTDPGTALVVFGNRSEGSFFLKKGNAAQVIFGLRTIAQAFQDFGDDYPCAERCVRAAELIESSGVGSDWRDEDPIVLNFLTRLKRRDNQSPEAPESKYEAQINVKADHLEVSPTPDQSTKAEEKVLIDQESVDSKTGQPLGSDSSVMTHETPSESKVSDSASAVSDAANSAAFTIASNAVTSEPKVEQKLYPSAVYNSSLADYLEIMRANEKLLGKKFADCPEIGPDLLQLAKETVDALVVFFTNKADQYPARELKDLKDQYKAFFKAFLDIFVQEGLVSDDVHAMPLDGYTTSGSADSGSDSSQSQSTDTVPAVDNAKGSSAADNPGDHGLSDSESVLAQRDGEPHNSDYFDESDDGGYETSESTSESGAGSDGYTDIDTDETDGGSDDYDETDDSDKETGHSTAMAKEQPSEGNSDSSNSFLSPQLRELIEKVNQLNKLKDQLIREEVHNNLKQIEESVDFGD